MSTWIEAMTSLAPFIRTLTVKDVADTCCGDPLQLFQSRKFV